MIYSTEKRIIGGRPPQGGIYRPRGGAIVTPAWVPTDKTGLQIWFQSDLGVTSTLGLVSQWNDQSGNGRHATASGLSRPTITANVLNSKPGIAFTGINKLDFVADVLFTSGSAMSVCIVTKQVAGVGTYYQVPMVVNTPVTNRVFSLVTSNDANFGPLYWCYVGANGSPAAGIKASGDIATAAGSWVINYAGGTPTLAASWDGYLNNTGLTETVGGSSQFIGNMNRIGNWYDSGLPYPGNIMLILLWNSVLTALELASVDDYVFRTYAI